MGRKNKLQRFAEMKTFDNVFEPRLEEVLNAEHRLKGKWNSEFFKNDRPLTLELGCGKGEYTVGLARKYPERNFLGFDIKGARMWVGAKEALENEVRNVGFVRTHIDFITSFFEKGEVEEIWITFPDPQPKDRQERKRLTSDLFLDRYLEFMEPGTTINLKTDDRPFYEYTLEQVRRYGFNLLFSTSDLYGKGMNNTDDELKEILSIKTYYEKKWLEEGKKICYARMKVK